MGRTLSWLANGVLFVLCCYLVADTANDVFAALLTPSPADLPASAGAAAPAAASKPWSDREVILTRNLFNASLLAPAEPTLAEAEAEELEETKLPLRLLGTAASDARAFSWAAVQDESDRKTLVVGLNDAIRSAVVERIERRRIVLREGGELRELLLDEEDKTAAEIAADARQARAAVARRRPPPRGPAARRAPPAARPPEPVKQIAEDQFEVERDDVDDLIRNPATLFTQARILPKYEEGAMVGLQINAIKPGSLFENIGIQSGDVITKVNGITIDDPQESAQILSEFSEATSFTVDVERSDGSTNTLEFSLEDSE